jgi:hypothetical protein
MSILLLVTLALTAIPLTLFVVSEAEFVIPEYRAVYLDSGLAGKTEMPEITADELFSAPSGAGGLHSSTPAVGTTVFDWYLGAATNSPYMTLMAIGEFVEVWVSDDLSFPDGDPRNDSPWLWQITQEMADYIAEQFDANIYANVAGYYGPPADRDGTGTIFEALGWPAYYYDWVNATDPYSGQRIILKVMNYQDENYIDPTYPSYVAGFFSSTYSGYYNRNMMHLDCWEWAERLGEEGRSWIPAHPEVVVDRPNLYESVFAHEFQHNIHRDYVPDPDTFINEACSLFAEPLCGFELDLGQVDWFMGTPDNSLNVWEDQGNINVLADYGAAFMFALYLTDHYGINIMGQYVQNGVNGIEGIEALLPAGVTFDDVFHDWRLANLIQAEHGRYGYQLDELRALYNPGAHIDFDELEPLRIYEVDGPVVPWTNAGDAFGETYTIGTTNQPGGYATGVFDLAPYSTDYIKFNDLSWMNFLYFDGDDDTVYGWTYDDYWGEWWSGAENLADALLITNPYTVQAGDVLSVPSWYDIEDYWDFGFVQFSTDGGETWTSMANEWTTMDHDPSAIQTAVDNLPGITGNTNNTYRDLQFNLDDYIAPGTEVIFGFRYVTDWNTLHAGWYIVGASVGETALDLIPVYPEADFMVTVVEKYEWCGRTRWRVRDMWLWDGSEFGAGVAFGSATEVYLVVSLVTEQGTADYNFKNWALRRRCWCW